MIPFAMNQRNRSFHIHREVAVRRIPAREGLNFADGSPDVVSGQWLFPLAGG